MHQEEGIQIYTKIFKQLGIKWMSLIQTVKENADQDDESQIDFKKFCKIIDKSGVNLSKDEKSYLLEAFPGQEGGEDNSLRINVARIYDQKYNVILEKMYSKVDVANFEGTDEPMDPNGYLGKTKFYRD